MSRAGETTAPAAANRTGRGLGYMPGIDGLRTVAVVAVVIYHLGATWLPGGYLGVDVFLVISGFLITSLLLAEHRASGRIDLRRFWFRRARRLLPAVLLMLTVVLAVMVLAHPDEVGRLRGQVVAALAYVINWHFIFADVPYFEQFGRPSVLLHLWSLAIEEQFYLVWPPLLALGLVALGRRALLLAVGLAAAGSTALAWVLWEPFTDPSRIYYGTDTRAVALLVGVGLALLPAAVRGGASLTGPRRRAMEGLGWLGAAGVLVAFLSLGDVDERLYRGGFLLVALATAGLVAVAADSSSFIGRLLGTAPLVWLGLLSYGIYLWHWPVIMLTRPDVDIPLEGAPLVVLRLALTLGAAYLSYRFVEAPFRRYGIRGVREALAKWDVGRPARIATVSSVAIALTGLALAVALTPARSSSVPGLTDIAPARGQAEASPTSADGEGGRLPRLLFVGDSVMLVASSELRRAFGSRAVVDAAAGRRFPEGADIAMGHLRALPNDTVVIIHLGNNYFIDPRELDSLLDRLSKRPRILLLTVRVPLPWQDSVNDAIHKVPARHANVSVVDWHARSGGPGLLVDGAHMSERGMRLYAETISGALGEDRSRR